MHAQQACFLGKNTAAGDSPVQLNPSKPTSNCNASAGECSRNGGCMFKSKETMQDGVA
jgi:hypothetical protein